MVLLVILWLEKETMKNKHQVVCKTELPIMQRSPLCKWVLVHCRHITLCVERGKWLDNYSAIGANQELRLWVQADWGLNPGSSVPWPFDFKLLKLGKLLKKTILKSRDITLPAKVHIAKAMVFPVVVSGCESWNIKKSEHWRTYAFKSWCWRRFLRVPWIARRSNQ